MVFSAPIFSLSQSHIQSASSHGSRASLGGDSHGQDDEDDDEGGGEDEDSAGKERSQPWAQQQQQQQKSSHPLRIFGQRSVSDQSLELARSRSRSGHGLEIETSRSGPRLELGKSRSVQSLELAKSRSELGTSSLELGKSRLGQGLEISESEYSKSARSFPGGEDDEPPRSSFSVGKVSTSDVPTFSSSMMHVRSTRPIQKLEEQLAKADKLIKDRSQQAREMIREGLNVPGCIAVLQDVKPRLRNSMEAAPGASNWPKACVVQAEAELTGFGRTQRLALLSLKDTRDEVVVQLQKLAAVVDLETKRGKPNGGLWYWPLHDVREAAAIVATRPRSNQPQAPIWRQFLWFIRLVPPPGGARLEGHLTRHYGPSIGYVWSWSNLYIRGLWALVAPMLIFYYLGHLLGEGNELVFMQLWTIIWAQCLAQGGYRRHVVTKVGGGSVKNSHSHASPWHAVTRHFGPTPSEIERGCCSERCWCCRRRGQIGHTTSITVRSYCASPSASRRIHPSPLPIPHHDNNNNNNNNLLDVDAVLSFSSSGTAQDSALPPTPAPTPLATPSTRANSKNKSKSPSNADFFGNTLTSSFVRTGRLSINSNNSSITTISNNNDKNNNLNRSSNSIGKNIDSSKRAAAERLSEAMQIERAERAAAAEEARKVSEAIAKDPKARAAQRIQALVRGTQRRARAKQLLKSGIIIARFQGAEVVLREERRNPEFQPPSPHLRPQAVRRHRACRRIAVVALTVVLVALFTLFSLCLLLSWTQLNVYLIYVWGECRVLDCRDPQYLHGMYGWLAEVGSDVSLAIVFDVLMGEACKALATFCVNLRNYEWLYTKNYQQAMLSLLIETMSKVGMFAMLAFVVMPAWAATPAAGTSPITYCADLVDYRLCRAVRGCAHDDEDCCSASLLCLSQQLPFVKRRRLFERSLRGPFMVAPFVRLIPTVIAPWVAHKLVQLQRQFCERRRSCTCGCFGGFLRILHLIFTLDFESVGGLRYIFKGSPYHLHEKNERLQDAIHQGTAKPFEPLDELVELKMNFIFVVLFAPLMPLGVATTVVARLLELRTKLSKLFLLRRRSLPQDARLVHDTQGVFVMLAAHVAVIWHLGLNIVAYNKTLYETPWLLVGSWLALSGVGVIVMGIIQVFLIKHWHLVRHSIFGRAASFFFPT